MQAKLPLLYGAGLVAIIMFGFFLSLAPETDAASPSSIEISTVPENPSPGENTNVTLNSFINNLDSALIAWTVNGKQMFSGIGKKSFLINAPAAGSEITVIAVVDLPDGLVEKKIVIRPASTVLLWQANDSYVPPFYRGKAMPTAESEVKVVAMPEIRSGTQIVNPKNMVYEWKLDYTNDQENSGYGKNFYIYLNDYLDNSNSVSVAASTIDQKYSSVAGLNIRTFQPKILFYRNDPDLGTLWERALANGHKIIDSEVIEAVPYFISPQDIRVPTFSWDWSINGSPITLTGFNNNMIPLKVEPGVSGTSKMKLEITNKFKIFQEASKEITLEF